MEAVMRAIKATGWEMGRANFTIKKEVSMMENGRIIICMGMASCTILIISLPMKDNGL